MDDPTKLMRKNTDQEWNYQNQYLRAEARKMLKKNLSHQIMRRKWS